MTNIPFDIDIPDFCLVLLVGAPKSGKTRFAFSRFSPSEVVGAYSPAWPLSDETVADILSRTEILLKARSLVVVDAPNSKQLRRSLVALANKHDAKPVAIVLDTTLDAAHARAMEDGSKLSRRNLAMLVQAPRDYSPSAEGFRLFHKIPMDATNLVRVARVPLAVDKRADSGPFDIIGDVHGCADELVDLLTRLGYEVSFAYGEARVKSPHGRKPVLLGDLVDRGPASPDVVRIAMAVVAMGGHCVRGNHDDKLRRALSGARVPVANGLARSLEQFDLETPAFRAATCRFIDGLPAHVWLDGGDLAVAHAGILEGMLGRSSASVDKFTMYGHPTGEENEHGLPVRHDWGSEYSGSTHVVYGHTTHSDPEWVNGTLCVDTGCVFGGSLTALRWPERELVSVPARRVHCDPVAPIVPRSGTVNERTP